MKTSLRAPRWRPMKSAPKDGSHILLAYESFSDNGKTYTGMGRWVECPHLNQVEAYLASYYPTHSFDNIPAPPLPEPITSEGHWEVGYIAVIDHFGRHYQGQSYRPQSIDVTEKVLGWLPLPTPPKSHR